MRAFQPHSPYARGLVSRETDGGPNLGAPTNSQAKKDWNRRWTNQFARTVRCAHCPNWSFTGNGWDAEQAWNEHQQEHTA